MDCEREFKEVVSKLTKKSNVVLKLVVGGQ